MTTARFPMHLPGCRGRCAHAGSHPEHHDRLLAVDTDVEALLELLEVAVTWHELDYSESSVVPPRHWARFLDRHIWRQPEVAERAFRLAEDIVRCRGELSSEGRPADVVRLVVG